MPTVAALTPAWPAWVIRAADVDDAATIARFHTSCWKDAYRGIVPDEVLARSDVDARTLRWRRRLGAVRRSTAVAELSGTRCQIVGLVSWGPSHDAPEPDLPTLELASLYVTRELWGSGLAGDLLVHALRDAPAYLWVYDGNVRARAFYEKHGFVHDGAAKVDEETSVLECRYARR